MKPIINKITRLYVPILMLLGGCALNVHASLERFAPIILNHHFYHGQNFVYPIPFEPQEIAYHPESGVVIEWHRPTRALRFVTKNPGSYGVQIFDPTHGWLSMTVTVYPRDFQALASLLHHISMRGAVISANIASQENTAHAVSLSGTIYDPRDWIALCELLRNTPTIHSEIQLYAPSFFFLFNKLKAQVRLKFGPDITLRHINQNLIVEGSVASESDKSALAKYLSRFHTRVSMDELQVGLSVRHQVQIHLGFIEVKKNSSLKIGINHNDHQLSWRVGGPSINFESILSMMVARGEAKILSQPNVVARYGKAAELHIGGEIPFEIKTKSRLNIEWKKYGIIMNITPQLINNTQAHLDFELSVSFPITSANKDSALPALSRRAIRSEVIVPLGETAILSGMLQHIKGWASGGLPGLSELPVLGHLFKSSSQHMEQTELIVTMTPKPYDEGPDFSQRHFRQRLHQREVQLAP